MPVLTVDIQRQEQAVIGQTFEITYNITNISNKPAFNIGFGFSVEGSEDRFPFTATAPEAIKQLDPGASAIMTVEFKVDETARENTYRVTSNFEMSGCPDGQRCESYL